MRSSKGIYFFSLISLILGCFTIVEGVSLDMVSSIYIGIAWIVVGILGTIIVSVIEH